MAYFEHSLCDESLKADEIKEHFREVTKMMWVSEGACYLCGVPFILINDNKKERGKKM